MYYSIRAFAWLIALALIVSGCSENLPNSSIAQGQIIGTVTDASTGDVLAGVSVTTVPLTQAPITDESGSFEISEVLPQTYAVTASKSGYQSKAVSVSVTSGQTVRADFALDSNEDNKKDPPEIPKGAIVYYPFNGDATDETGNGHDGLVFGAMLATDRFGREKHAYSFDGFNDYIEVEDAQSLNFGVNTDFTVVAWVKFSENQTDYAGIIVKCTPDAPETGYQLIIRDGTVPGTQIGGADGFFDVKGAIDLADSEWHMVTLVGDRETNTVLIYADGILHVTDSDIKFARSIDNDRPLYIGRERQGVRFFNGLIDDVRIYSRALTIKEIEDLYNEAVVE